MEQQAASGTPAGAGNTLGCMVVRLQGQGFAISLQHVREVVRLPRVVHVPHAPAWMRGVMDVRGEVLSLVDLRSRMGKPSHAQEFEELSAMIQARLEDHRHWLHELEASVRERRPFTLATDPHQCRFGKWYDSHRPTQAALAFVWASLDRPHQNIHAIAEKVLERAAGGDLSGATAIIERARGEDLAALEGLLNDTLKRIALDNRELAVLLHCGERHMAIAVDEAESVEDFAASQLQPLPDTLDAELRRLTTASIQRGDDKDLLLLIDPYALFGMARAADEALAVAA